MGGSLSASASDGSSLFTPIPLKIAGLMHLLGHDLAYRSVTSWCRRYFLLTGFPFFTLIFRPTSFNAIRTFVEEERGRGWNASLFVEQLLDTKGSSNNFCFSSKVSVLFRGGNNHSLLLFFSSFLFSLATFAENGSKVRKRIVFF